MSKTTIARRPDLTLEDAEECIIWIVDMACPAEANIAEKRKENCKNTNSLHLKFARGMLASIVPFLVGCLGGGMKKLEEQIKKLIKGKSRQKWVVREIQKIVLMESEAILKKIMSGVVQVDYNER